MQEFAKRFMSLFAGLESAHGTYRLSDAPALEGMKNKGQATTLREPVTLDLWNSHLCGDTGIGIIPIREDNTSYWGCIDVDVYNLDIPGLVCQVRDFKLPLLACRSKSGGAHLFLFLQDPVPAAMLQAKLREIASALGYGKSEIFPKQGQVLTEKGDIGNWLNMPYFGGDQTNRYAVTHEGTALSMAQFLNFADRLRLTRQQFDELRPVPPKSTGKAAAAKLDNSHPLHGAPPCLQTLAEQGLPEGTRNNGLYNFGVFAKKKFPDAWEAVLDQFNHDYMDPPLGSDEVQLVAKTLAKKEYLYKCNDQPICGFCNAALCRTRKFGIGASGSVPIFSSLSKLNTTPPLWFLDVEGARLELTTEQIQNQRAFQKVCMEQLNLMPPPVKEGQWVSIMQDLLDNVMIIDAPREVSTDGQFQELLEEFVGEADIKSLSEEELLLGKPWFEEKTHRVYFRLRDLMAHLERNNFKELTRQKITTRVRDMKGGTHFFNIKGKGVNTWYIPMPNRQTESFEVPDMNRQAF